MSRASSSQPNPTRSYELDFLFSTQPTSHQNVVESSRRPRCPECGTRKMRLSSGQLICKRGHVQQHFRVEQGEDDGFLGDGVARKLRAKRVVRVKKLKSQFTSLFSFPDTDVEPDDDDETDADPAGASSSILQSPSVRSRRSSALAVSTDGDSPDDMDTDTAIPSTARKRTIWHAGVGLQGTFEGRFSLLQCLQLVLRLQLHALRRKWGDKLPPQTEAIARDLWAMLVSQLPTSEYPPEPLIAATFDWHTRSQISQQDTKSTFPHQPSYDPEQEMHDQKRQMLFNHYRSQHGTFRAAKAESAEVSNARKQIDSVLQSAGTAREWHRASSELQHDSDDLPDAEDELAELDPIFAEQRRRRLNNAESSVASPTNVDEDIDMAAGSGRPSPSIVNEELLEETNDDSPPKRSGKRPAKWAHSRYIKSDWYTIRSLLKLPTTISIIYLTLWLLKIPILWNDLTTLIKSFELPYLNVVHKLPLELTKYLNHYTLDDKIGLDTDIVPSVTALHQHTVTLADLLHATYDIAFGEGNQSGMLIRLVRGLALPPPFYVASKRTLSTLDKVSMKITTKEQNILLPERGIGTKQSYHRNSAAKLAMEPKEFILLAAILVNVKMRYGLDGHTRYESLAFHESRVDHRSTDDMPSELPEQKILLSCAPELKPWLSMLDSRAERVKHSSESVWDMDQDLAAMDMSDAQLHAYALFAEQQLVLPNKLEIHAWRREEARRHWTKFDEFVPTSASRLPVDEVAPEHDHIASLYKRHIMRPASLADEVQNGRSKQCGASYVHHQFRSDTTGLALSPTYTRVLSHANRLVGIQLTSSSIDADLAQKVRTKKSGKMTLEQFFGIQAHVELVEELLFVNLQARGLLSSTDCGQSGLTRTTQVPPGEHNLRSALSAFVGRPHKMKRAQSAKFALSKTSVQKGVIRQTRIFKNRKSSGAASKEVLRLERQERETRIQAALDAFHSGECPTLAQAAREFSVARKTLADRVKGAESIDEHLARLHSRQRRSD